MKIWLITGANRGIGRAIAEEVLLNGHKVVAACRNTDAVQDLVEKHGKNCIPVEMDLNDPGKIEWAVGRIQEELGKVDVLVNNAGYGLQGAIEEVSMDQVRMQMETNFFGLMDLTKRIIPMMRENSQGYIVNVSSIAGMKGTPTFGSYNASKFAVNGFSEALYHELKPLNIRVSIVEPGPYRTDWAGPSLKRGQAIADLHEDSPYFDLNKQWKGYLDGRSGQQPGDPKQIAKVLLQAANSDNPPLHMIFGDEAINLWNERMKSVEDSEFLSTYPHGKTTF